MNPESKAWEEAKTRSGATAANRFAGSIPLYLRDAGDALATALEAERDEHRRTAERWDEERRKWYAERERLIAQIVCEVGSP